MTRFEFTLDPLLLNGNVVPSYVTLANWAQEWQRDLPDLVIEIESW